MNAKRKLFIQFAMTPTLVTSLFVGSAFSQSSSPESCDSSVLDKRIIGMLPNQLLLGQSTWVKLK